MVPTPTPAPPMPMQAIPAPIIFAAVGSMEELLFEVAMGRPSMARVKRIVEIDAGEDGEHVGLQHRHQEFERRERHGHPQWHYGAEPAEKAPGAQHPDETGEHF